MALALQALPIRTLLWNFPADVGGLAMVGICAAAAQRRCFDEYLPRFQAPKHRPSATERLIPLSAKHGGGGGLLDILLRH